MHSFNYFRMHKQALDGEVFDVLFSLSDFVKFKESILDYKNVHKLNQVFFFWFSIVLCKISDERRKIRQFTVQFENNGIES